jgi:hypothetical protein
LASKLSVARIRPTNPYRYNSKENVMSKFIFILFLAIPCIAYSGSREEKIETLMKSQGLLELWTQQIDYGKKEGNKQAKQIVDQMLSKLNPSDEYKSRFEEAYMNFIAKLQDNWTAQQIVDVWAMYYGPHFSEKELDELVLFYTSEIGQKAVKATRSAMVEFVAYFQKENKPIMEKATNDYIEELKLITTECNCLKKQ